MNRKLFLEKSQIDKKLCIHCKHCSADSIGWDVDKIMCGLYRSEVDDSPLYRAWENRYNPHKCGGKKWEISLNIVIRDTKEVVDYLSLEQDIEGDMPFARELVRDKKKPFATCGSLDLAIERAEKELCRA